MLVILLFTKDNAFIFTFGAMEGVKGSTRKKLIGSFYAKNWQHGKLFTVKYFQEMGVPPKTTYRILKECDEGRPMQRKPGSGRPAHKMKQNKVRALIRYLEGKVGVSQRKAAKKIWSKSELCGQNSQGKEQHAVFSPTAGSCSHRTAEKETETAVL